MNLIPFIKDNTLIPLNNNRTLPTSLSANSKTVQEGGLFVAISGTTQDGTTYIDEALARGANAIVTEGINVDKLISLQEQYSKVSFFKTNNARKTLSLLSRVFYPLQPNNIIAVTGTNGKTSVVSFIRQIWSYLGIPGGSLGTLGLIVDGKPFPSLTGTAGLNTPDPIKFHEILHTLKKEQVEHLAFEASSHGIHQHRLDSVQLKAAVFTNFSNDHLDYHEDLESYFEAKCRLFKELLPQNGHVILNSDIPKYKELYLLCQDLGHSIFSFGRGKGTLQLLSIKADEKGQIVNVNINNKFYSFILPLVGEFQVYNVLAALCSVIACGGKSEEAIKACSLLTGVPGRLEEVAPHAYIDYSHTPEGLALALKALRPHTKGKLWLVFGCGGNRDALKRPMMGKIADDLADKIIITDDNPRHENPAAIRQQILAKCPRAGEIPSRQQAIQRALDEMGKDDVVLIAGKGHETYQLIGDQILPFNDKEEVQKYLKAKTCAIHNAFI